MTEPLGSLVIADMGELRILREAVELLIRRRVNVYVTVREPFDDKVFHRDMCIAIRIQDKLGK